MVPIRATLTDSQKPSRRHSRGHTEEAAGLNSNSFNDQSYYPTDYDHHKAAEGQGSGEEQTNDQHYEVL